MTAGDIQVILHRLDQLEITLEKIHSEVRKTNGRVNDLEKLAEREAGAEQAEEAARLAAEASRRTDRTILLTLAGAGALAIVSWFVGHSLNV